MEGGFEFLPLGNTSALRVAPSVKLLLLPLLVLLPLQLLPLLDLRAPLFFDQPLLPTFLPLPASALSR
jgi:hypothetical protein